MQHLNVTKVCAVNLIAVLQEIPMSYKTCFACPYADGLLERSQARIGLHTLKSPIMKKRNTEKDMPKYTSRLMVRLTPQLHKGNRRICLALWTDHKCIRTQTAGREISQAEVDGQRNGSIEQPFRCQRRYTETVWFPKRATSVRTREYSA